MGREIINKRGVKIDDRNRIVIQSELLEEMGLRDGDYVSIYADYDENKIIIKKGEKKK